MDLKKLYEILGECTVQLRKGAEVVTENRGPLHVTHVYAMPHESEARPELELVDVHFMKIGVDKAKAAERKDEFVELLRTYPQPDRLAGGPSYIEVGAEIGDQGAAFQLFALGKVLGLWEVITPEGLGLKGEQADKLAGGGLVMCSGFRA